MHIKQKKILRKLVKRNAQRYSELCRGFVYEDKFAYHLKQLIKHKFVNKREKLYFLTKSGMRETAYFDRRTFQAHKFKIPLLLFICKYDNMYFINNHYDKDPTRKDFYVLPTGVVPFGETLKRGGKKILKRKYGISGELQYRATHQSINYSTDGDTLFDDICIIYDVKATTKGHKVHYWYRINEIEKLHNRHPMVDLFILKNNRECFGESKFSANYGFEDEDI